MKDKSNDCLFLGSTVSRCWESTSCIWNRKKPSIISTTAATIKHLALIVMMLCQLKIQHQEAQGICSAISSPGMMLVVLFHNIIRMHCCYDYYAPTPQWSCKKKQTDLLKTLHIFHLSFETPSNRPTTDQSWLTGCLNMWEMQKMSCQYMPVIRLKQEMTF